MNPVAERIARAMKPTPSMKGREEECTEPSAAEIVRLSGVKGLTEEDVRTGKNPDEIAQIWLSRMLNAKSDRARMEQEEREAEQKQFPLLPYSQLVYNMEQQMPGVYTFAFAFSYDINKIDTARLSEAIATAIANHPVFRSQINSYSQKLHMGSDPACSFAEIKAEAGILHIRLNRILGDGYSFGMLLEDICKAYQGIALEPDYYFRYLQQVENHKQSKEYKEHEAELRERYGAVDGITIPVRPTLDKEIEEGDEWLAGEYVLPLPVEKSTADFLPHPGGKGAEGGKGASLNTLVCQATALAIMDYCGTNEAALTWAYLGRDNEQEQHIFGSLHKDIPMLLRKSEVKGKSEEVRTFCELVKEEMQRGIRLSDYPWTLTDPQHHVWQYAVNVLQQPRLEDLNLHGLEFWPSESDGNDFDGASMERRWSVDGGSMEAQRTAYSLLDIEIEEGQLRFRYSATHYKQESIIRFAQLIRQNMEKSLKS